MRESERRRSARLAVSVGGLAALRILRSRRPRWSRGIDPCGDGGMSLPAGVRTTVVADDGARLSVLAAGPETGPVVVLAHCWMGRMELWGPVARRLVDSGHRVVLFDQRGHGGSSMGSSGFAVDRFGDDLGSILAALGLDDVVLAGHSMGGMAVLALAAQRPDVLRERVRGVALVATSAHNGSLRIPPRLAHAVLGERASTRLATRDPWRLRRAVGVEAHRGHLQAMHEAMVATAGVARAGCLAAMGTFDYRTVLPRIRVPTTILVGTHDRLTPPARARVLASGVPAAQLRVLDGLGHMLPLEAPDVVASTIARLATVRSSAETV
jgi:non-heme chloroperoxidase